METTTKMPVFPNDLGFFFHFSTMESLVLSLSRENEPLRQPHYQIIWIIRGSGTFEIDLETFRIEANTIYTIPPGRYHAFRPAEPLAGWVISFNTDFLNLAIQGPGVHFFKEIDADLKRVGTYFCSPADGHLQHVLADIKREFDSQSDLRLEVLSGLLRMFLLYMKRQAVICYREDSECLDIRLYKRFYLQLDNQFRQMKSVSGYATALCVTPGYLNSVIKRVTGHTAKHHIRQRTIQEAKRMVVYDEADMKIVAHFLGFDDLAHFSKYFKKEAGMTFSQFKKMRSARRVA